MGTHPDPDARQEQASNLPALIIGVVGLYLGGFAVIVLDELVFRTNVLSRHSPEWVGDVVGVVYWPLIQLFWLF
jgi:hypothetical protein